MFLLNRVSFVFTFNRQACERTEVRRRIWQLVKEEHVNELLTSGLSLLSCIVGNVGFTQQRVQLGISEDLQPQFQPLE